MRWIKALVLGVVLAPMLAVAANAVDCGSPTDLHDGWTVAAPDQEGLDPALICGIGPRLEALKEANARGVVIARHGRLVYEHYFAGKDWRLSMSLGDVSFDAGTKHDIRSISKSVTVARVSKRVFQILVPDAPTPERCVEAYHIHRTRLELIAERKFRRRLLTDDAKSRSPVAICGSGRPHP
jgi:hypothetical protein